MIKYEVVVASKGIKFVPHFENTGQMLQKLKGNTQKQHSGQSSFFP
jgi:hypothetical protein